MGRLDDTVALVSGGARGLGASHARMLVAEGARVVVGDVLDGDEIATDLGEGGRFVHLDVTQPESWDAAVATAVETFGGLDVLVNNAGIVTWEPIDAFTHEQWDAIIAVNLTGVVNGVKAATPALKRSGSRASIINVSSTAGLQGYASIPGYVASKWAVRGFSKAVALDLAQYGVRCNSIHPGAYETPHDGRAARRRAARRDAPPRRSARGLGAGGLPRQRRVVVLHRRGVRHRRRGDGRPGSSSAVSRGAVGRPTARGWSGATAPHSGHGQHLVLVRPGVPLRVDDLDVGAPGLRSAGR